MAFAIKAPIDDREAGSFAFDAVKTMYGGRQVLAGDMVYMFASETSGGAGLIARGTVIEAAVCPRLPGVARQTPRVSLLIRRTAPARRPLGRAQLRGFTDWHDGRPETELNFKFYRQATDKLVGITGPTAAFLDGFF